MTYQPFYFYAEWTQGRASSESIEAGNFRTKASIPHGMDAPGIVTNPDEMLLGAASTCYVITLAAMIERAELPLEEMALDSEGIVDVSNGVFTYKKIIHRPKVRLKQEAGNKQHKLLQRLVERAEA